MVLTRAQRTAQSAAVAEPAPPAPKPALKAAPRKPAKAAAPKPAPAKPAPKKPAPKAAAPKTAPAPKPAPKTTSRVAKAPKEAPKPAKKAAKPTIKTTKPADKVTKTTAKAPSKAPIKASTAAKRPQKVAVITPGVQATMRVTRARAATVSKLPVVTIPQSVTVPVSASSETPVKVGAIASILKASPIRFATSFLPSGVARLALPAANESQSEAPIPTLLSASPRKAPIQSPWKAGLLPPFKLNQIQSPFATSVAPSKPAQLVESPLKASALRSPIKMSSPKKSVTWNQAAPQAKSPEPLPAMAGPLDGAVVYLDIVHHGEDASALFAPLVEPLGASLASTWTADITHVVFGQGSQATLEKAVATHGAVKCVSIGWLIDCDKHKTWLDETHYRTDLSHIPGSLTYQSPFPFTAATPLAARAPMQTPSKAAAGDVAMDDTLDDFGNSTISDTHWSFPTPTMQTPVFIRRLNDEDKENKAPKSLTDSPEERLVQKSAPPKQIGRTLLDVGTPAHSAFKRRLMAGKRRSEEFAPNIGSPLKKMRMF
ncbi:hypothetical protein BU16DRAFT_612988 [Lophium mytilinum]|uniref:BRCT domain-containing protein n=1 Tax=Lophium mytilinum TaxID=390894 RepID=A0A6A6RB79_9PEZI|nr:hypothetical protein BU16DRAFT_612988 [Lophium mytilinum]